MKLTNKQVKYLKSLGHDLAPVYQIGKDGITENMLNDIDNYLLKYEIVKVKVLQNCDFSTSQIKEIFEDNGFYVVQKIGSKLILFQPNPKLKDRIRLP